eukprot:361291-Chlamydomonas_euryale.AAC.6
MFVWNARIKWEALVDNEEYVWSERERERDVCSVTESHQLYWHGEVTCMRYQCSRECSSEPKVVKPAHGVPHAFMR